MTPICRKCSGFGAVKVKRHHRLCLWRGLPISEVAA